MLSALLVIAAPQPTPSHRRLAATPSFTTSTAAAASKAPTGMSLVSRAYVPYGKGTGLEFGMGAAEQATYDATTKIAYTASEQGFVNAVSYADAANPVIISNAAIDLAGQTLTDIDVCGTLLAVGLIASTKTDPGSVRVYTAMTSATSGAPSLLNTYTVGPGPDNIQFNSDCSKIAVANEAEGSYGSSGLVDPEGSLSIISNPGASGTVATVSFAALATSDADMISQGVHLPLAKNAMEYFDSESTKFENDIDFTSARAAYTTATQLEPEYVAWSSDGTKIYVSCQENSAIVTVDVASATATSIKALGLKDWSSSGGTEGLDTIKDGACTLAFKPGFKTVRMPDSIAAVAIDGTEYILTADEGDDKEYGDFESKQKFKDVLDSATAFDSDFFEFGSGVTDAQAMSDANANFGGTKMAITIGSTGVDYSDPKFPKFKGAVGFGGRGISIWKASDMSLTWDSGSTFEKEQCAAYPWAHNGVQDEEFASTTSTIYQNAGSKLQGDISDLNDPAEDGCDSTASDVTAGTGCDTTACACPLGKTVDERSLKDGAGPEAIVVGEACGRMLAVTATEKQGTAFVFDITTITAPTLLFVKHLSPASQTKNPTVAYTDGDLGEIDPESITFLTAANSPTGNAGVLFAGAWSGTLSLYEFKCGGGGDDGLGTGALVGIIVGALVGVAVIGLVAFKVMCAAGSAAASTNLGSGAGAGAGASAGAAKPPGVAA